MPFVVKAEVCDNDSIKLVSIEFEEKTDGVEENAEILDNVIKLDAKLFEVNEVAPMSEHLQDVTFLHFQLKLHQIFSNIHFSIHPYQK